MGKTISPSQIKAAECRLAWYWGYNQGFKAKRRDIAFELGIGIHHALERYYGFGEDLVSVFTAWAEGRVKEMDAQWQDEIDALVNATTLGKAMLQGYWERYGAKDDFTVLATEHTIRRALPTPSGGRSPCKLTVRLDGLVRDHQSGKLFSLEHKSFSKFSLKSLDLNSQFTAQVWAGEDLAESLGLDEPIAGVLYNGLRKQAPGPRVKLALFERHKLYRNQAQIEQFLLQAYWTYRRINQRSVPIYPEPSEMRCGRCDFADPCIEYQRGGDCQFILEQMYERRDSGGTYEPGDW